MNRNPPQSTLNNLPAYQFLLTISLIYLAIMMCNAILTNRYVGNDKFFVLGGTLTSPFVFILDDIVAEIYGYRVARWLILSGYAAQTLFVCICQLIILAPFPSFFKEEVAYSYILGPTLLRIDLSGFAAYLAANLLNSYIICRWKLLLKGRCFWVRSIGASLIAEAAYSFLAIFMMELKYMSFHDIFKVVGISYSIKAIYSAVFSSPANLLVNYIKKSTGVDVYDFHKDFTPFKYL